MHICECVIEVILHIQNLSECMPTGIHSFRCSNQNFHPLQQTLLLLSATSYRALEPCAMGLYRLLTKLLEHCSYSSDPEMSRRKCYAGKQLDGGWTVEYTEIRRHDAIDMDPHYIAPMVLQFIIWLSLANISLKRLHAATVAWLTDHPCAWGGRSEYSQCQSRRAETLFTLTDPYPSRLCMSPWCRIP